MLCVNINESISFIGVVAMVEQFFGLVKFDFYITCVFFAVVV